MTRPAACALRGLLGMLMLVATAASGQEKDLDTPYVQTPQNVVDRMLELAKVGASDYVIDLGSGDGRMVITAASRYGARGFGVDLDRRLVELANRNAAKAGVAKRARFYERDLFETDFAPATVLTLYLLPDVNLAIRSRVLTTLKPGTRVVSHDYDFGDWPPDAEFEMPAPGKTVGARQVSRVLYWVVPATVAGKWRWETAPGSRPQVHELTIDQNYQRLSGTLVVGGRAAALQELALSGASLRMTALVDGRRYTYAGKVAGQTITGTVREMPAGPAGTPVASGEWKAARIQLRDPRHLAERADQPSR